MMYLVVNGVVNKVVNGTFRTNLISSKFGKKEAPSRQGTLALPNKVSKDHNSVLQNTFFTDIKIHATLHLLKNA